MAFRFLRSARLGPLRFHFSNNGLSILAGLALGSSVPGSGRERL